jgi:hypothetical protein
MKTHTAKLAVADALYAHGIDFDRLRARRVSFADLARDEAVSVRIEGLGLPNPAIRHVKEDLPRGVILDLPSVI